MMTSLTVLNDVMIPSSSVFVVLYTVFLGLSYLYSSFASYYNK